MAKRSYERIIALVLEASRLAKAMGIPNLLQPGLVKEMIIAEILGHELITSKRDSDARDSENPHIVYEYLTCKEGGSGQFDRMFKSPAEKREQSLTRIRRNSKIYLAIFYAEDQTKVKTIYELEPNSVEKETIRRLGNSRNNISHVGFSERWARENGIVVFSDNQDTY
ncbi:MAG: hypothetical protein OXP68_04430 [Anaerolineaceae bacterium]|nr:hypothetical protein [Anaerolineaceae bacterium]MDE0327821.1 hypothetical protein [Anaerolineaceae bacterium]